MPKRKAARGRGRGGKSNTSQKTKNVEPPEVSSKKEDEIVLGENEADESIDSKQIENENVNIPEDIPTTTKESENESKEIKDSESISKGSEEIQLGRNEESQPSEKNTDEIEDGKIICTDNSSAKDDNIASFKPQEKDISSVISTENDEVTSDSVSNKSDLLHKSSEGGESKGKDEKGDQIDEIENRQKSENDDNSDNKASCEQVEEVEEVYMDNEMDDDVQYIDEEIEEFDEIEEVEEDGEQDLLDVMEMGDNVNASHKIDAKKDSKLVTLGFRDDKESKSKQDEKEDVANTTFEEISEGSMDPMEQEEVIIETISDNEMILESSSQTAEKVPSSRDRKISCSPIEEDETLADIFKVTENDDHKLSVEVNDKDNDAISDASLCADDEDGDGNNLSLEEISDDELDSSKRKKLDASHQPPVTGSQEENKMSEDITAATSGTKVDDSLSQNDESNNDENAIKQTNKDVYEASSAKQQKLIVTGINPDQVQEASEKAASVSVTSESDMERQAELHLPKNVNKLRKSQFYKKLMKSYSKSTDAFAQTHPIGKRGKIVQCSISRADGSGLSDVVKKEDPDAKIKEKVTEIFDKYRSHLPSSVESIFKEVASWRAPDEGIYNLSLGPVTLADFGNKQFRDVCLNSAEKFNMTYDSKMHGLLQAQFSKHKEVNRVIHNLKNLNLGIRYMILSLVYRANQDDTSQRWQAILILTYSQDESQMKAWSDGNDGKVRSKLSVTGVPAGISKDFVHLLFPEALYISTTLGKDDERSLSLGFSSTKISKDISSCYELLLFNGDKAEISSMEPAMCETIEDTSPLGFVEEDGTVIVEDLDEEKEPPVTSGDTEKETNKNMEATTPEADDKTKSDEKQQGSTESGCDEVMDTSDQVKTADENDKEECKGGGNVTGGNELGNKVNEAVVTSHLEKTPNEGGKEDINVNPSTEEDEQMEVEDNKKSGETNAFRDSNISEKEMSSDVAGNEILVDSGMDENADDVASKKLDSENKGNNQEKSTLDSRGAVKAMSEGDDKVIQETKSQDGKKSEDQIEQDDEGQKTSESSAEKESASGEVGTSKSCLNDCVDQERNPGENKITERDATELLEETMEIDKNVEVSGDKDKLSEKGDLDQEVQDSEKSKEIKDSECDKDENLEDVSDDEIVGTDVAKSVKPDADDDDDVIILKEEPSKKVVASIDLTGEEQEMSKDEAVEDDNQEGNDKSDLEKEIKVEDLKDDDKLTMKDGDFEIVLESIDIEEDEKEYQSVMVYETVQTGGYRGKYYNSKLKRDITMSCYRNLTETDGPYGYTEFPVSTHGSHGYHSAARRVPLLPLPMPPLRQQPPPPRQPPPLHHPPMPRHPPPQPPPHLRDQHHNISRKQPPQEFNYNRVYSRPENEIRNDSHRVYDKVSSSGHSGGYLNDRSGGDPKSTARRPVPSKEETPLRRESGKREYRRSQSPSPRRDVLERPIDSSYHHSSQSANFSSNQTRSYKSYRDHKASNSPPANRQASSSSYYDYKNIRSTDEHNTVSRSRHGNSKYEVSSSWRDEYHSSHQQKAPSTQLANRQRDRSRSFSPLSVSSSELLSRTSPPPKRTRRVSHSPISRSLSPISKSPSPPPRVYNTKTSGNKYRSSPPKAYRDRYSPISARDFDTGRTAQRRSRSRSPYKSWDKERSRKRSRSPQYQRRSSPNQERRQIHDKVTTGSSSSAAYRSTQPESSRVEESSRNRSGGSKYERHIKELYDNKNLLYKKASALAATILASTASKESSSKQVKRDASSSGDTKKSSYSQSNVPLSASGYKTVPQSSSTSHQQQHQQQQSHMHPPNYPPPPVQATTTATNFVPQPPMFYPMNPAMYNYNMGGAGGMNPAAYQPYGQQQAVNNPMMYSYVHSTGPIATQPNASNPYAAYNNAQQQQQQHHHHMQQQQQQHQTAMNMRSSGNLSSSGNTNNAGKSSSSSKPSDYQNQSSEKAKHWSMGDGGNALMFQRILSTNKGKK